MSRILQIRNALLARVKRELSLCIYNLTTLYQRRAEHLLSFMFEKSKTDNDLLKHQLHILLLLYYKNIC